MHRPVALLTCFFCLATFLTPTRSLAQSGTGVISGRVVDPSGGALPGTTVTIRNTETGVAREVIANEQGLFSLSTLAAGLDDITAELTGFQGTKTPGVVLNVSPSSGGSRPR